MRVLWVVNMVFPEAADALGLTTSESGGWMPDMARLLSTADGFELAVMTYYSGKEYREVTVGRIRYLLFPGGGRRLLFSSPRTVRDCRQAVELVQPELIHIYGTEYAPAAAMLRTDSKIPILLTIQGVMRCVAAAYNGGLSFTERLRTLRLRDMLRLKTVFTRKWLYRYAALRENFVLRRVRFVSGRTAWDRAAMLAVNPGLLYYRAPYILRAAFYDSQKWSLSDMRRYTILTGAAGYPLKGLHVLLRALAIVRKTCPQVRLYVPGGAASGGRLLPKDGYQQYILRRLKELQLRENVCFTGTLNAEDMAAQMRAAHVLVIPSAMENDSVTACEAQLIGTPVICARRGGMTETVTDKTDGLTYDFADEGQLAACILQVFGDDRLAQRLSLQAISTATARHDRESNLNTLCGIYRTIRQDDT